MGTGLEIGRLTGTTIALRDSASLVIHAAMPISISINDGERIG